MAQNKVSKHGSRKFRISGVVTIIGIMHSVYALSVQCNEVSAFESFSRVPHTLTMYVCTHAKLTVVSTTSTRSASTCLISVGELLSVNRTPFSPRVSTTHPATRSWRHSTAFLPEGTSVTCSPVTISICKHILCKQKQGSRGAG